MRRRIESFPFVLVWVLFAVVACSSDEVVDGGMPGDGDDDGGQECPVVCSSKADCCAGMDCIGGVCVTEAACTSGCNYECDRSQHCDPVAKKCVDGTAVSYPDCQTECQCYSGESCIGGVCTPSGGDEFECTVDEDCPEGQVCRDHSCRPESCTTREDCEGPVCLVCRNGQCTEPPGICQGDQDCCVGYHCNFGTCVPDVTGCQDDNDCIAIDPEFPVCRDNVCVHECERDVDCLIEGEVCVDNHCEPTGCTPQSCDQELGRGYYCDTASGDCLPGCDSNDDCISPETCNYATHQCGTTDCCGGICDQEEEYCDTLTCQCVQKCTSDAECPAGFICDIGSGKCRCTDAGCPTGTHCDAQSGSCVPDQTGECETDADCPPGQTCDLFTLTCRSSGGGSDGDTCFTDDECDAGAGYYCDSSLFCIGCMLVDPNFLPTFTCRAECSMFLPNCPANYECLYRHTGLMFLCIPDSLLP
ncbi:MAG: hypothetical protein JXR96_25925 [Deltaproteobacteria bacterium]|nr:hypothetical protein [Deltaproteobacteria bacterium]